jgi:hypothetical protein
MQYSRLLLSQKIISLFNVQSSHLHLRFCDFRASRGRRSTLTPEKVAETSKMACLRPPTHTSSILLYIHQVAVTTPSLSEGELLTRPEKRREQESAEDLVSKNWHGPGFAEHGCEVLFGLPALIGADAAVGHVNGREQRLVFRTPGG